MTTTLVDPPALSGFTIHYGIPVAAIGEDGELVALGRHEPRRAFAAFCRFVRTEWGWNFVNELRGTWRLADRIRHERFVVGNTCGDCDNQADCINCEEVRRHDWWLRTANTSDSEAFAVTIWS